MSHPYLFEDKSKNVLGKMINLGLNHGSHGCFKKENKDTLGNRTLVAFSRISQKPKRNAVLKGLYC
jgi:hypothetical protein